MTVRYADTDDAFDLYGSDYVNTSVRLTTEGDPDLDTLCKALVKASSEIDSYLSIQYTLPLATVPEVIVQACIDMAIYRTSADAGTGTEEKRKRYDDAIRWLKDIARGIAGIIIVGDAAPATQSPEFTGPVRLFSRSTMRGL